MILSDREIQMEIESGGLRFTPAIDDRRISPSSLDLLLGNVFTLFDPPTPGVETIIDIPQIQNLEQAIRPYGRDINVPDGQSFDLRPGDFILAYTKEFIEIPNYLAARVEGRSSYARVGVSVHQTASTIHATFRGQIRLEISHAGRLSCRLQPGTPICQLVIEKLSRPAEKTLQSDFQSDFQDQPANP